jgi:D-alanyl-D-alanine carboxypeptidase
LFLFLFFKDGWTEASGSSIAASYEEGENNYILCSLGLKEKEFRWIEVPKLLRWVHMQLKN